MCQRFNKGRCSVEIEKPLRPEDIGTWRIYHSKTTESGCVFRVQDDSPIPQSNANGICKHFSLNIPKTMFNLFFQILRKLNTGKTSTTP